jgi:hypothetical protein
MVKIRNKICANLRYSEVKPFYLRLRCICERLHLITYILIFTLRLRYGNGVYVKGPLEHKIVLSGYRKSYPRNLKMFSNLTFGLNFKVKPRPIS